MLANDKPLRPLSARMEDRLIVALDLPSVVEARAIVAKLNGVATFYKIGLWLIFAPGFEAFLDDLLKAGCNVFPVLWRKGSKEHPLTKSRCRNLTGAFISGHA
jgi:hypothetical protein